MQPAHLENSEWDEQHIGTVAFDAYSTGGGLPTQMSLADGKPLYILRGSGYAAVVWGQRQFPGWKYIRGLSFAGGKPLYVAERYNEEGVQVVWGEEKGKLYAVVDQLRFAGDKPLYRASQRPSPNYTGCSGGGCLVWGKEEGLPYDSFAGAAWHDRDLFYCYRQGEEWWVSTWGKENRTVICKYDERFDFYVRDFTIVEGEPLYCFERIERSDRSRREYFVVWGDQKSRSFCFVAPSETSILVAHDQLLFCAVCADGDRFVVWGDNMGSIYEHVTHLTFADGKPLYKARRGAASFVVWGEEEGMPYDEIWRLAFCGGKPLYLARQGNDCLAVWGKEKTKIHGYCVNDPMVISGKPVYCTDDHGEKFVVWGDEESPRYQEVFSLSKKSGQIVFGARKEREIYCVSRRIV